jgi:hypothetical protein
MHVNYSGTQANGFHQCWDIGTELFSLAVGLVAGICLEVAMKMFGNLHYFAKVYHSE